MDGFYVCVRWKEGVPRVHSSNQASMLRGEASSSSAWDDCVMARDGVSTQNNEMLCEVVTYASLRSRCMLVS